jgi:hypothetical protein
LGVFHKSYATAKDADGWLHIDRQGKPQYSQRYAAVEPFYNGFALVHSHKGDRLIIDEQGRVALHI